MKDSQKSSVSTQCSTQLTCLVPLQHSSTAHDVNRGRSSETLSYQIKKFRDTSPSSDPFAPTGFGPETNRQQRINEYISQFDSVYTANDRLA